MGERSGASVSSNGSANRETTELPTIATRPEAQTRLEPFLGKQIWEAREWYRRTNQESNQHDQVPEKRRKDVTYGKFVCSVRPEKKEKNRTRLVVGEDRINYIREVATPAADMLLAKLLFNSVISTKGSRFMTMDISNFYLNTPLTRPEYIKIKLGDIPDEVINEYKLRDKVDSNGYVHI